MSAGAPAKIVETLDSDLTAFAWRHPFIDKAPSASVLAQWSGGGIIRSHEQREIFSFHSDETGPLSFDVRGIKDALVKRKLRFVMMEAELNAEWVEHLRINGGVEVEHMARLTAEDLERPGVAVLWGNDYTTLLDGNNRLVRRWDDGLRMFRFARINDPKISRYVCRPGEEESFFTAKPPKGTVSLSKKVIVR